MNSSDSGWDFTMRTNMSNTSLHGMNSNSKSGFSLGNNMSNSHSMLNFMCSNDEALRRKMSMTSIVMDHRGDHRNNNDNYKNYTNSNSYSNSNSNYNSSATSVSDMQHHQRSLDTSYHGVTIKSSYENERDRAMDHSNHGMALRNPSSLLPYNSHHSLVKNAGKVLTRESSREYVSNRK